MHLNISLWKINMLKCQFKDIPKDILPFYRILEQKLLIDELSCLKKYVC